MELVGRIPVPKDINAPVDWLKMDRVKEGNQTLDGDQGPTPER